jgi:hypothetical protein
MDPIVFTSAIASLTEAGTVTIALFDRAEAHGEAAAIALLECEPPAALALVAEVGSALNRAMT